MNQTKFLTVEDVARICHEANRAYCLSLGDHSQPLWADAPEWQRKSSIAGVEFHLRNPDATDAASHNSWLEEKRRDGWKYGPVKDPEKKEHHCFVHFHELPVEQKVKDRIFRMTVDSVREYVQGDWVVRTAKEKLLRQLKDVINGIHITEGPNYLLDVVSEMLKEVLKDWGEEFVHSHILRRPNIERLTAVIFDIARDELPFGKLVRILEGNMRGSSLNEAIYTDDDGAKAASGFAKFFVEKALFGVYKPKYVGTHTSTGPAAFDGGVEMCSAAMEAPVPSQAEQLAKEIEAETASIVAKAEADL